MKEKETLAIVAPVYNEADVVGKVLRDWSAALDALAIDYTLLVYNDGSRDDTLDVLRRLENELPRLQVVDKPNSGHGPTVLRGYREASDRTWICQIDSDGEMGCEGFSALWRRRADYDFLIAYRTRRRQPWARKLLTLFSTLASRLLFGIGVDDANCPYRLMRSASFKEFYPHIPDDTFAPNLIISGLAVCAGMRIFQHPVPHNARLKPVSSFDANPLKILAVGWKVFLQTLRFRRSFSPSSKSPVR